MQRSKGNQLLAEKRKRLAELKLRKEILDLQARIDSAKSFREQSSKQPEDAVEMAAAQKGSKAKDRSVADRVLELDAMRNTTRSPVPLARKQHEESSELPIARKKIRSPIRTAEMPKKVAHTRSSITLPEPSDLQNQENKDLADQRQRLAALEKEFQSQGNSLGTLKDHLSRLDQTFERSLDVSLEKRIAPLEIRIETTQRNIVDHLIPSSIDDARSSIGLRMDATESRLIEKIDSEIGRMNAVQQSHILDRKVVESLIKEAKSDEFVTIEKQLKVIQVETQRFMENQAKQLHNLQEENTLLRKQMAQRSEDEDARIHLAVEKHVAMTLEQWIAKQKSDNETLHETITSLQEDNRILREQILQTEQSVEKKVEQTIEQCTKRFDSLLSERCRETFGEYIAEQEKQRRRQEVSQIEFIRQAILTELNNDGTHEFAKITETNTKIMALKKNELDISKADTRRSLGLVGEKWAKAEVELKEEIAHLRSLVSNEGRADAKSPSNAAIVETIISSAPKNHACSSSTPSVQRSVGSQSIPCLNMKPRINKFEKDKSIESANFQIAEASQPNKETKRDPSETALRRTHEIETNSSPARILSDGNNPMESLPESIVAPVDSFDQEPPRNVEGVCSVLEQRKRFNVQSSDMKNGSTSDRSPSDVNIDTKPKPKETKDLSKMKVDGRLKPQNTTGTLTPEVEPDDSSDGDDSSVVDLTSGISETAKRVDDSVSQFHEEYQYVSDVESSASSCSGNELIDELPTRNVGTALSSTKEEAPAVLMVDGQKLTYESEKETSKFDSEGTNLHDGNAGALIPTESSVNENELSGVAIAECNEVESDIAHRLDRKAVGSENGAKEEPTSGPLPMEEPTSGPLPNETSAFTPKGLPLTGLPSKKEKPLRQPTAPLEEMSNKRQGTGTCSIAVMEEITAEKPMELNASCAEKIICDEKGEFDSGEESEDETTEEEEEEQEEEDDDDDDDDDEDEGSEDDEDEGSEEDTESQDESESESATEDDRLVGVEKLKIGNDDEVELRRRALALLGIGGPEPEISPTENDVACKSGEAGISCDTSSQSGNEMAPRSVLRPSSFLQEGFDWRKRPVAQTSVSFSDDVVSHEVPKWSPEEKIHLFYDKVDINRFRLEDKAKKEAKANKEKSKLHTAIDSLPSFWG